MSAMQGTLSAVRRLMGRESAVECKSRTEKQIAALQAEADALSGKEHQKARAAKGKKIAELRDGDRYIDACRVVKGLAPTNGHFTAEVKETTHGEAEEQMDPASAARLAAEATAALKRLDEATRHEKATSGGDADAKQTPQDPELEELRQEERRLTAKLAAQRTQGMSGLPPSATKEVEKLLAEISELKAGLRADGLTENEQDKDERVLLRLVRVAELQQHDRREKKQERRERSEFEGIRDEIDRLRAKVDAHKRRLREEGLTSKDVKQDPGVGDLEERLVMLQRMGGA